jgi:hypothetical protein
VTGDPLVGRGQLAVPSTEVTDPRETDRQGLDFQCPIEVLLCHKNATSIIIKIP